MSTSLTQRGYSLLEMIVSLGIFSMVMLVVMGAYVTLISLDRQARANNQLAASLSFAVESMARSMRTGTSYDCNAGGNPLNCSSGGGTISFLDSQGQIISYIQKSDGSIGQCTGTPGCLDNNAVSLTDRRINITSLRFYVRGVGVNDDTQPNVTFVIAGTMTTDAGEVTDFSIQTGATQRLIEL
ncbi:MAG: putative Type pilus pilin [Patescibacteria group bacterium]|nr:putative Type pilus pilin [Patescibacteria group bacterium]